MGFFSFFFFFKFFKIFFLTDTEDWFFLHCLQEHGASVILRDIARARENIQKSLAGVSTAAPPLSRPARPPAHRLCQDCGWFALAAARAGLCACLHGVPCPDPGGTAHCVSLLLAGAHLGSLPPPLTSFLLAACSGKPPLS